MLWEQLNAQIALQTPIQEDILASDTWLIVCAMLDTRGRTADLATNVKQENTSILKAMKSVMNVGRAHTLTVQPLSALLVQRAHSLQQWWLPAVQNVLPGSSRQAQVSNPALPVQRARPPLSARAMQRNACRRRRPRRLL